jgi:hypothetical protein
VTPFWPQFPGSEESKVSHMTINGIDTISQSWRTTSPGEAVIGYFREQMGARGWKDTTAESLGLQAGTVASAGGRHGPEYEEHVLTNDALRASTLNLVRDEWSMEVVAAPDAEKGSMTDVRVLAAATPSSGDLLGALALDMFGDHEPGWKGSAIDTVEERGGLRRHTTFAVRSGEPEQVFDEVLGEYRGKGWQCMVVRSPSQRQDKYFAWAVKGGEYAAVGVQGQPRGGMSSVALTEITPK